MCEHDTDVLEMENQELRARVARLEGVLRELSDLAADDVRPGATMCDAEDILEESKQQALAEVKAEALREAIAKFRVQESYDGNLALEHEYVMDYLGEEASRILQEAKDA